MKHRVIIIDDEPLACQMVQKYLSAHENYEILQVCNDGFSGAKAIQEHKPDLIFLDVQMPKLNGFEMLEILEEVPRVIFTTAFDEYAIKAFDNNAADYLLKPFSPERFKHALEKYEERQEAENTETLVDQVREEYPLADRVVIKNGPKIHIVGYDDILYIEADDDYVKVRTTDGAFAKKRTLTYFEKSLPEDVFVRVHRSYLLNIHHLVRLEQNESGSYLALLSNDQKVAVSRNGHQLLKQRLDY